MAFESGFQAGLGLPMVDHPLAGLMEKLAGGYETGAKMAALPQQQQLMNALRAAQAEQAQAQAGLQTQQAREKGLVGDYLQKALAGDVTPGAQPGMPAGMGDALLRKLAGLPEETPQEKQAREVETARLKSEQAKRLETELGTTAFLTQRQKSQQAANQIIPKLERIQKEGSSYLGWTGAVLTPSKQADYEATINELKDLYVTAKNLPGTTEGLQTAENIVMRRPRESEKAYLGRIKRLTTDMREILGKSRDEQPLNQTNDPLGIR